MSYDLAIWKRSRTVRTAMLSPAYEALCDGRGHEAMDSFDAVSLRRAFEEEFGDVEDDADAPFLLEVGNADGSDWAVCHLSHDVDQRLVNRILAIAVGQGLLVYDPQREAVWGNRRPGPE